MLALYARYLSAKETLKNMLKGEEEGQTIIEYVLLLVLIALIALASFPGIGTALAERFEEVLDLIETSGA
jgi:Flp pilus assembly pilin Flp